MKDLREAMGSNGRHLMVQSLAAAVKDNDEQAVSDILEFCNENRILLHVTEAIVFGINLSQNYDMMRVLIRNFI